MMVAIAGASGGHAEERKVTPDRSRCATTSRRRGAAIHDNFCPGSDKRRPTIVKTLFEILFFNLLTGDI